MKEHGEMSFYFWQYRRINTMYPKAKNRAYTPEQDKMYTEKTKRIFMTLEDYVVFILSLIYGCPICGGKIYSFEEHFIGDAKLNYFCTICTVYRHPKCFNCPKDKTCGKVCEELENEKL